MKTYYRLTKPGIIYGNALPAAAGFFLAGAGPLDWVLFVAMLLGLSLVVGAGCVFNNYFDREIDARMERTKERALVAGTISARNALVFGVVLLVLGVGVLYYYTNTIALAAALVGFVVYVFLYTPLKHKSGYALYVGAVAGAMPPVVGYAGGAGVIDTAAITLFALLFLWQLPHFISIALYRYEEYAAAGVPLLIKRNPSPTTKRRARFVFFASLVLLLVFCLASVSWRLLL